MKLISLIILLVLIPFWAISQPLQPGSLDALNAEVQEYMNNADPQCYDRQTEFIVLFIKVDHNGSVININLMGDEKHRDSTYIILSKMSPRALRRWEADSLYRNKIIVLPVFSQGLSQNPNYIDKMNGFGILSFQQCGYNDRKSGFVISPQMTYYPQYYRPELHRSSIMPALQRNEN
jgi:hypothetical protein